METGLDRPQGRTCSRGDLIERQVGEEAHRDHAALLRGQRGDGSDDLLSALVIEQAPDGIVLDVRSWQPVLRTLRVDPHTLRTLPGTGHRQPQRDAPEPGPERSVTTVGRQRPVCPQERLLGDVLGLVRVAQDSAAERQDIARLTLDQDTEGLLVPGEHRVHELTVR